MQVQSNMFWRNENQNPKFSYSMRILNKEKIEKLFPVVNQKLYTNFTDNIFSTKKTKTIVTEVTEISTLKTALAKFEA